MIIKGMEVGSNKALPENGLDISTGTAFYLRMVTMSGNKCLQNFGPVRLAHVSL